MNTTTTKNKWIGISSPNGKIEVKKLDDYWLEKIKSSTKKTKNFYVVTDREFMSVARVLCVGNNRDVIKLKLNHSFNSEYSYEIMDVFAWDCDME